MGGIEGYIMKATLHFDLDDQDDKQRHEEMLQSHEVLHFLHEWEQQLRHWRKYAEKPPTFDEVDDKFFEILREAEIRIW